MLKSRDTILVIGIGNEFRSDDAAGLIAARRIKELGLTDVNIAESDGDGARLMDLWYGRKQVILIDAVQSGAKPGTLHVIEEGKDIHSMELFRFSTHTFGILQALKLSEALDILPGKITIYGIEGGSFASGAGLTSEVEHAVTNVETLVHNQVLKLQRNIKEKSING
jgi:hydrogenase maturation protease